MSRSTNYNKTPLDNFFSIPIGAEEIFEHQEFREDENEVIDDELLDAGDLVYDEIWEEAEGVLLPPDGVTIVSQALRRAPGGQFVIDVVFEVDDVYGAEDYETKVAPV